MRYAEYILSIGEFIFRLLRSTARPFSAEPYGAFHLFFLILGVPAAVAAACLIPRRGEQSERQRRDARLFFAVGVCLCLGETYKQLFYPAVEGAWRADLFPFQLCSVPMYICILIPFIGARASRAARTFLATFGLLGGAASYIAPGTMLRPYLSVTIHSFLWHLCLIFLGVYAARTVWDGAENSPSGEDFRSPPRAFFDTAALYLILCLIALVINIAFHPSHPEVNMFYLGPTPSTLPVCRDITARFGVAVNSVLYAGAVLFCAFLIYLLWPHVMRLSAKRKETKT